MYRITAMDLQERLILMLGGKADEDSVTDIRTAIRQAMRLVSAEHSWPYYHDYMHLNTVESVDEGTIAYTASTRTVVLTGSTWPTWILRTTTCNADSVDTPLWRNKHPHQLGKIVQQSNLVYSAAWVQ